jgi:hypothetical protein
MTRKILIQTMLALAAGANAFAQQAEPAYDLLLRGGHVLDDMRAPANGIPTLGI